MTEITDESGLKMIVTTKLRFHDIQKISQLTFVIDIFSHGIAHMSINDTKCYIYILNKS